MVQVSNYRKEMQSVKNKQKDHTPGPWYAFDGHNTNSQLGWGVWPAEGAGYSRICSMVDGSKAEANAHLVAAAPDLLAALCGLVGCHDSGYEICRCAVCDAARAAIARAEGKAQ
jgi:hypothetical protein